MLERHERLHLRNDEHSFSCKICALEFGEHEELLTHLSGDQHRAMKVRIQGVFVCVDCRRVFPSRDAYAMHALMRAQSEVCSPSGSSEPSLSTVEDLKTTIKREPTSPVEERQIKRPRGIASSHYRTMASESLKRAYAKTNWFSYGKQRSPLFSEVNESVTCLICYASLKNCDALAMHMMERHAHYQVAPPSEQNALQNTVAAAAAAAATSAIKSNRATYDDARNSLSRRADPASTVSVQAPRPKSSSSLNLYNQGTTKKSPLAMVRSKSSSAIYDASNRAVVKDADECRQCGVSFCEHTAWNLLTSKSTSMMLLQQKAVQSFATCGERVSRAMAAKMAVARHAMTTPSKSSSYRVVGAVEPRAIHAPESDERIQGQEKTAIIELMTANKNQISMCAHCKVVFLDRTLYHLHMGTHNRNDPWQCNLCGHRCQNVHEFTSHVIHYK